MPKSTKKISSKSKRAAMAKQLSVILESTEEPSSSVDVSMSETFSCSSTTITTSSSVDFQETERSVPQEEKKRRKSYTKPPNSPLMKKLWETHSDLPLSPSGERLRQSPKRKALPFVKKSRR